MSTTTVNINPLLFYMKPNTDDDEQIYQNGFIPLQVVYPSGNIDIALPVPNSLTNVNNTGRNRGHRNETVIASGPENTEIDLRIRANIVRLFTVIAIFNIIVTSCMYFDAPYVDYSKVQEPFHSESKIFERVSSVRSTNENILYSLTIIILCLGEAAMVTQSSLGISVFCLACALNLIFGLWAFPYFVYVLRYMLDALLVYIALTLRSKLIFHYLQLHIHHN